MSNSSWIDLKTRKPPFNELVEVKGSDFRGEFEAGLMMRVKRKHPNIRNVIHPSKWKWIRDDGEVYRNKDEIFAWRPINEFD